MGRIADNLALINSRIQTACTAAGRDVQDITLVAVSKRMPLELVKEACLAGHLVFGENRIQDAVPRQAELRTLLDADGHSAIQPRWHFIGHLQSNKANKAAGAFELIHAVDSVNLAERLRRRCEETGERQDILIEINASAEPQKNGLPVDAALDTVLAIADIVGSSVQGLMTMSRFGADTRELSRTFATVRKLAEDVRRQSGLALPTLSMGMSGDFEVAIAEGATQVRIGTAIFGPRDQ
jgi:PLP dependent protein